MRNKHFFILRIEWEEIVAEIITVILFVYFSPQISDSVIKVCYYFTIIPACIYFWSRYSLFNFMSKERGAFEKYVIKRIRGLDVVYIVYLVIVCLLLKMRSMNIGIWFLNDIQFQTLCFVIISISMLRGIIVITKQSLFKRYYKKL